MDISTTVLNKNEEEFDDDIIMISGDTPLSLGPNPFSSSFSNLYSQIDDTNPSPLTKTQPIAVNHPKSSFENLGFEAQESTTLQENKTTYLSFVKSIGRSIGRMICIY
jgi:hypothetical protein